MVGKSVSHYKLEVTGIECNSVASGAFLVKPGFTPVPPPPRFRCAASDETILAWGKRAAPSAQETEYGFRPTR